MNNKIIEYFMNQDVTDISVFVDSLSACIRAVIAKNAIKYKSQVKEH